MNLIENLEWRYATKDYDPTKRVSEDDIHQIREAIRLSPSSYGLQLFKVLDIADKAVREKLKAASYGQSQIEDASHLLVFCGYSVVNDEHIDELLSLTADTRGFDHEVGGAGSNELESPVPIGTLGDSVAEFGQTITDDVLQLAVIVDNEHFRPGTDEFRMLRT